MCIINNVRALILEHVSEIMADTCKWRRKRKMERGCNLVSVRDLKDGMEEYEMIKGYHVRSEKNEKETMRYLRVMWNSRQRHERWRECGLE